MEDAINKFIQAFRKGQSANLVLGKVLSVDRQNKTAVLQPLITDSAKLVDVRLKSVSTGNKGILFYPPVNSIVVAAVQGDLSYIVMMDDFDSFTIINDNFSAELDQDGNLIFNDGIHPLVKWLELKTQLDLVKADLENLKTSIAAWVPVPSDGGAALKTILAAFTTMPTANFDELEDQKIKH